jgi:glyceraldehyde-3-phosphate dehydrogenase (NADP+)
VTVHHWPILVGGTWTETATELEIRSPYDDQAVGRTFLGNAATLESAITAAHRARRTMAALAAHERATILRRVSARLIDERETIATTLASEAGKPLGDARAEVDRASLTLSISADEALRIGGEMVPLDVAPAGIGRFAVTRRVPIGLVAGISPFNFPLNLVAHKLGPALAAGVPIVLKPATRTPLSALTLARLLDEAGLPKGGLSVLPLDRATGDRLVTDDRFNLLSFTGSPAVGWDMKARAGRKRVVLELGGNAGVIVDRDVPVERVVPRLVAGGFTYAGQSCISVQRIFVHEDLVDALCAALVAAVDRLVVGDPLDPATDVGPLISADDAERVAGWVDEAVGAGARVLTGGRRIGRAAYAPTVLRDAPATAKVCAEEAFAPLVTVSSVRSFDEAVAALNASRFGLQAGVFTNTLSHAVAAFDEIEVGGIILNDVPAFRIDHMPYGGVKDSGFGREGPRYAIEEMTDLRLLVVTR